MFVIILLLLWSVWGVGLLLMTRHVSMGKFTKGKNHFPPTAKIIEWLILRAGMTFSYSVNSITFRRPGERGFVSHALVREEILNLLTLIRRGSIIFIFLTNAIAIVFV